MTTNKVSYFICSKLKSSCKLTKDGISYRNEKTETFYFPRREILSEHYMIDIGWEKVTEEQYALFLLSGVGPNDNQQQ